MREFQYKLNVAKDAPKGIRTEEDYWRAALERLEIIIEQLDQICEHTEPNIQAR